MLIMVLCLHSKNGHRTSNKIVLSRTGEIHKPNECTKWGLRSWGSLVKVHRVEFDLSFSGEQVPLLKVRITVVGGTQTKYSIR